VDIAHERALASLNAPGSRLHAHPIQALLGRDTHDAVLIREPDPGVANVPGSDFLDDLPFRAVACSITQNLPSSPERDVLPALEHALVQLPSQLLGGQREVALHGRPQHGSDQKVCSGERHNCEGEVRQGERERKPELLGSSSQRGLDPAGGRRSGRYLKGGRSSSPHRSGRWGQASGSLAQPRPSTMWEFSDALAQPMHGTLPSRPIVPDEDCYSRPKNSAMRGPAWAM
jgi:hypothetical protein